MTISVKAVAYVVAMLVASATASFAAPQDYRFEVIGQPVKAAHDAVLVVHVSPLPTHKLSITSQTLHMIMGSMDAPAKITPLPSETEGDYRFSADLTMYGEWALDLVGTIAGDPTPIKTSLKLQVVK